MIKYAINTSVHNQRLLDSALKVQKFLERFCIESTIAGGLPRDIHYGVDAKDADICVYNFHPYDSAERVLFLKMLNELDDPFLGKFGSVTTFLEDEFLSQEHADSGASSAEEDDHQVWGVIKLSDVNVDIIFYEDIITQSGTRNLRSGERITDAVDIVDQFDANINQFVIEDLESGVQFYGHSDLHPDKVGLKFLRETTSESRKEKMRSKWLNQILTIDKHIGF